MSDYGRIIERQLESFQNYYANIKIASYVIMPNHVHLLLYIPPDFDHGPSTVPTGTVLAFFRCLIYNGNNIYFLF